MYKPIAKMLGVADDYFKTDFASDMSEKLADVPEEHLTAPKPSLAAPAMQQLGYSLDEPDLKEMYLNLLATASDDRAKEKAHPSFVEVIKQLSGSEIRFLEAALNKEGVNTPLVRFKIITPGNEGYSIVLSHVVERSEHSTEAIDNNMYSTYIDNWVRLGLVTVDYTAYLTAPGAYAWVETCDQIIYLRNYLNDHYPERSVEYDRGMLAPTDFGKAFAAVVGINDR